MCLSVFFRMTNGDFIYLAGLLSGFMASEWAECVIAHRLPWPLRTLLGLLIMIVPPIAMDYCLCLSK